MAPHRWQPGQSGNPSGRPKTGKRLTDVLRKALDEPLPEGLTKADKLAITLLKLAIDEANLDAIRYVYDRLDGKPVEPQEISGPRGKAVTILLRWADGSQLSQ